MHYPTFIREIMTVANWFQRVFWVPIIQYHVLPRNKKEHGLLHFNVDLAEIWKHRKWINYNCRQYVILMVLSFYEVCVFSVTSRRRRSDLDLFWLEALCHTLCHGLIHFPTLLRHVNFLDQPRNCPFPTYL